MTWHAGHIQNYKQHSTGGPVTPSLLSRKKQKVGEIEMKNDKVLYSINIVWLWITPVTGITNCLFTMYNHSPVIHILMLTSGHYHWLPLMHTLDHCQWLHPNAHFMWSPVTIYFDTLQLTVSDYLCSIVDTWLAVLYSDWAKSSGNTTVKFTACF